MPRTGLSLVLVPEYRRPRDFAAPKSSVRDLDSTRRFPEPPLSCSLCSSLPPPPVSSEPLRLELETFSLSVFTCHFFKHTYQSGELGGGAKTDVSLMPFYSSTMNLWKGKREREAEKTFAEILLQSTSFLPTTGNTSFVLMQY